ncbi:glycosyltransferase family 2 protein [Roseibium sp. CAU 1637]|uniref:Glycosyltransferase family 2 protein n=1 Tax=Roseibium limicola TaxID=2816037 RepID=A0A939ENS9_9HYPH|nr:glycosyltransferase family 2 protein [Roseibium limicola]MBO0345837.1 glycosyltransferase family 2 protein [Roseibium limicola]
MSSETLQSADDVNATPARAAVKSGAELSIVLPTFNEVQNVPIMVDLLHKTLEGVDWEVIVVDDNSPDGTSEAGRRIARLDPRVRVIRRIGRRGLSGACVEGILASSASYVAVMDADLQHDESLLPEMLNELRSGEADLVVASRKVEGGTIGEGLSKVRAWGSNLANSMAQKLLNVTLSDPMSGFFMIRRDKVEELTPQLSAQGFKILLDIVSTAKGALRIKELPFTFRQRQHGESKLDTLVTLDYFGLLLAKYFGDMISVRFLMFGLVGASGLVVHLIALRIFLVAGAMEFNWAQTAASFVAMTSNFFLNNQLTYRDRRLTGIKTVIGLFTFYAVCSVGVLANVGVADLVYAKPEYWWLAGTAGAIMGAVWNYAASSALTWKKG